MKFSFLCLVIFQYLRLCFLLKFENTVTKKKNRYKTRNTSRRLESDLDYSNSERTLNSILPQKYSLSYDNGLNLNEMTNMLQKSEDEENVFNKVEYVKGTPGITSPVFEKIKYTTVSRNFEKKEEDETSLNFLNIKEKVLDINLDKNKYIELNFSSNQDEIDTTTNYRKALVLSSNPNNNNNNNNNSDTYTLIDSNAVSDQKVNTKAESFTNHTESKVVTSNLHDDLKENVSKVRVAQNVTSYLKNSSKLIYNTLPINNTSENILDNIMDEVKKVFTLLKDFKFEKSFVKENHVIDVIVRSHNKIYTKDEESPNSKIILDEQFKINEEEKPKIKYISPRYYQHKKTNDSQKIIAKTVNLIKSNLSKNDDKEINLNLNHSIVDETKRLKAALEVTNYTNSSKFGFLITSEKSFEKKINNSIIHENRSKEPVILNSTLVEKINKKSQELLKKFQNLHDEKPQRVNLKVVSNSKENTATNMIASLDKNFSSLNPIFKEEILSKINRINIQLHNLHLDKHPLPHLFDMFNQNSLQENKNPSIEKANNTKLSLVKDISNQSRSEPPSVVTNNKKLKNKHEEFNFTSFQLNKTQNPNQIMNKNSDENNITHYLENIKMITKKIESRKKAMIMDKNINGSTKFSSILDQNVAREEYFYNITHKESNGTKFLPVHMISNVSSTVSEVSKMKMKLVGKEEKLKKKSLIVNKEANVSKLPVSLELIRNVTPAVKENTIVKIIDKEEKKSFEKNEVAKLKEKHATIVGEQISDTGKENYSLKYNLEKVEIDDNSLISEFFHKK